MTRPAKTYTPIAQDPSTITSRRDQVIAGIQDALLDVRLTLADDRRGFDPYNSRLGATRRDVWNRRRR